MPDLQDKSRRPTLEEMGEAVRNPLFLELCRELRETYGCREAIEYSSCSWERGWNVKLRRAGRTLCTLYPREGFFTALVVVGPREKAPVEALLPDCTQRLQQLYRQTREGSGQRWLMVDLEDRDDLYRDLLRLIRIRGEGKSSRAAGAAP